MYFFLVITQLLKTFNPYFRKHILQDLETYDFLFINTFFIGLFVLFFFIYKKTFHNYHLNNLITKFKKLSITQIIFFLIIAFITSCSSFILTHMDKNYNNPFINGLLLKVISAILLILVGVFLFEERYNFTQIIGVFLTILGLYLIMNKKSIKK
jgi:drug/metabolite transporter (DMT)-like permease